MRVKLVLQSFGRENEYKRAVLTILSYFAHSSLLHTDSSVILFTDQPDYFKDYLKELPVTYISLTTSKIQQMQGDICFLHRMKIAIIEEAFKIGEGDMLYADSDTFFTADPTPLMEQLTADISFMHLLEYKFGSLRNMALPAGETFVRFLQLIEQQTFTLADGSPIKITPEDASWNAGVMMFHASHERFIPDVFALTDQLFPASKNHASEQYAFSIMMQRNTYLSSCDSVIYHYWYRIKKNIIDLYLQERLNDRWARLSLADKLAEVQHWTTILPAFFEKHFLTYRDNAIQAFNENNYAQAYPLAIKALWKNPSDLEFVKDVLYHTKRYLKHTA